jgi:hypothetical protein
MTPFHSRMKAAITGDRHCGWSLYGSPPTGHGLVGAQPIEGEPCRPAPRVLPAVIVKTIAFPYLRPSALAAPRLLPDPAPPGRQGLCKVRIRGLTCGDGKRQPALGRASH